MFSWLRGRKKPYTDGKVTLHAVFTEGGLEYRAAGDGVPVIAADWLRTPESFVEWERVTLLAQIEEEGYAVTVDDALLLGWGEAYQLRESTEYRGCDALLGLPELAAVVPVLHASGSVSDPGFELSLGWLAPDARPVALERTGAVAMMGSVSRLLPAAAWRLVIAVRDFARRAPEERTQAEQERAWAHIRQLATAAGARLDLYLERTVILTAAELDLALRHVDVSGIDVVEVAPLIAGAPPELWLDRFDAYADVQPHYDLTTAEGGRIRVIVEPDAAAVLREIKRMPGRRVSGQRAEAFLRNPYALLGESMGSVVPPGRFEAARAQAGVRFYEFHCAAERDGDGRIVAVRVQIGIADDETVVLPALRLESRATIHAFMNALAAALDGGEPCFRWGRQTLELRGDASDTLTDLHGWLSEPWAGEPISYSELLNLGRYAPRVLGIGAHRPQYVPYLPPKDDGQGWVPENLEPVVIHVTVTGERITIPVHETDIEELKNWLVTEPVPDARYKPDGWPADLSPAEAAALVSTYQKVIPASTVDSSGDGSSSPDPKQVGDEPKPPTPTLLIKQNVDKLDYLEARAKGLAFNTDAATPVLPATLRAEIALKPHQHIGLAWLQHLWAAQEGLGVRGALLADDMGLGKTLQLLAFIAWYLETTGDDAEPALVVAPVSLLDNWQAELRRFFVDSLAATALPLYGDALRARKLRADEMDDETVVSGVKGLLRPGWRGDAKLVLTTYETLRDCQFGFGRERWSIMVCDEAQKIKTPGALMTHAAKAQNARFKIACTGTPVENTLADLWCLFDFLQPGLLGPLGQFYSTYRRPIETHTDEERAKLDELRRLIAPQLLRRMKSAVAELPPKHEEADCRRLPLSSYQRTLYRQAADAYHAAQRKKEEAVSSAAGRGNPILGLLHRLRSICADPRESGTEPDRMQALAEHRRLSPKLDWLIARLEAIRARGEKVIVFTEFRDLQRLLEHRVREHFRIPVAIINGSTKVGAEVGDDSRQARIDAFQRRPGFGVIILSTTAVGFGVNIQAANHVIHFTRAWNPAKEDQATDRAYRIGQTRPVHVYYPTVHAEDFDTFEAKLDRLLAGKRALAQDMLNGSGELDASEWGDLQTPDGDFIATDLLLTPELLTRLQPEAFERLCRLRLMRDGHMAKLTPKSGDGGIDVVAFRDATGVLVQCKSSSRQPRLGWEAVRDVVAGAEVYRRQHPNVTFTLVAATNQRFTEGAEEHARQLGVELWQQPDWLSWLAREAITMNDIS